MLCENGWKPEPTGKGDNYEKTPEKWQRVSKRRPCPICAKPDWCLFTGPEDSPTAVICARIESPKRCGEAGWLHILDNSGPTWSPRIRKIEISAERIGTGNIDLDKLAEQYQAAVKPEALDKLAQSLGLTAASLQRLGVGWSAKHRHGRFRCKTPTATCWVSACDCPAARR